MLSNVIKYLDVGNKSQARWTSYYLLLTWAGQLGNGAIQTITGPMQPFLAYNLSTDTSTINLVWTLGFLGFLIGSILTSHTFTKYLVTERKKLLLMFGILLMTGLSTLALPFAPNLPLLLLSRFIQFLCYGIFLTGDSILLVFSLGPEKSRPFINTLHFFISIGFLLGTFLVQPFLPGTREKVCRLGDPLTSTTLVNSSDMKAVDDLGTQHNEPPVIEHLLGVQTIAWPFMLSAGWCVLVSFGFLLLGTSDLAMPQFYDENTNTLHKDEAPRRLSPVRKQVFLLNVILFFALSGAVIRVFQSMSMTFALCGPLALESHRAALTDSFYASGMCFGRLASIFLATRFLPSTLLCSSTLCCLVASVVLILLAPHYSVSLYLGVAIIGFFVSWQFGTGFSWTSHHMDITGGLSSIFFIGLGVGSLSSPPFAGYLFAFDPMSMLYLVSAMILLQVGTVSLLWLVSRPTATPSPAPMAQHGCS